MQLRQSEGLGYRVLTAFAGLILTIICKPAAIAADDSAGWDSGAGAKPKTKIRMGAKKVGKTPRNTRPVRLFVAAASCWPSTDSGTYS